LKNEDLALKVRLSALKGAALSKMATLAAEREALDRKLRLWTRKMRL